MIALLALMTLQQIPVQGIVRDSITREPVAHAVVLAADASGRTEERTTDAHGAFVVRASREIVTLTVRAPGYLEWRAQYGGRSDRVEVLLRPDPFPAAPITALGRPRDGAVNGATVIDSATFRALPRILETDVLRAATLSSMATSTSDFAALPAVRGGTGEGVPVYLDGVRLFNPFHLAGFLSAINAEAVEQMRVSSASGGAALRHGALSGAIEIGTRDGAHDRLHASGGVGLASARATLEGPVLRKGTLLLDVRRTYLDAFTSGLAGLGIIHKRLPYNFADVHAKFTGDLGGVRRLSVTAYSSQEGFHFEQRDEPKLIRSTWWDRALAVHYRTAPGPSLILDLSGAYSNFHTHFSIDTSGAPPRVPARASMRETQLTAELSWYAAPRLVLAGAVFAGQFASSDSIAAADNEYVAPLQARGHSNRYGGFAELRFGAPEQAGAALGTRLQYFSRGGSALSPSLSLRLPVPPGLLHLEATESYQDLYSLRNEESRYSSYVSYDILVPVAARTELLRRREVAAGLHRDGPGYSLDGGGYVSWLSGLRLEPLGAYPLYQHALIDPDSQTIGRGSAWGLEFAGSLTRGRWLVMANYTYSHVRRRVAGEEYTPRFAREHEGGLLMRWAGARSTFSAHLTAQSGAPFTPVDAVLPVVVDIPGGPRGQTSSVALGGAYDSARLPSYRRLDLSWSTRRSLNLFGRRSRIEPYVAILNALNARNVLAADMEHDLARPSLSYLPQLPVLPFLGVEWRF